MPSSPDRPANALAGILLLARFRADGFACFAATPAAFLNSLAPLLGIAIVAGLRSFLSGSPRLIALHLLTSAVALLAPPVITHFLARLWQREALWLRYAVAFNWCQTGITLLSVVLILAFGTGGGMRGLDGLFALLGGIFMYWVALCWFLVWRGLAVTPSRAALAVVTTNLLTGILVVGPQVLAMGGR
jgi:hypothetical protein